MKISESSFYALVHLVMNLVVNVVCQDVTLVTNIAEGKNAYQSSDAFSAEGGAHFSVDGNFNQYWSGQSCSHTKTEFGAYWEVDLGDIYVVQAVSVYNRIDDCCNYLLIGIEVLIGMTRDTYRVVGHEDEHIYTNHTFPLSPPAFARWVRITRNPDFNSALMLCEVAVTGYKSSSRSFKRVSDVTGTGETLDTKFARSIEHCCYICFITQDCLAVIMDNSQCSLLNSDNYQSELGQTLYVVN